jgi:PAS domain S-box-containing protein
MNNHPIKEVSKKMSKSIRVLLVEDSEDDALLLTRELQKGGYKPMVIRVDTPEAMKQALTDQPWDLVISDYIMPKFSGLNALKLLQSTGMDLPFIIVSGKIGEETAVDAMRAGAHDYIMKSNLKRLVPAVERELADLTVRRERAEVKEELHESYAELEKANKKLQAEILEHNKAEKEAIQIKEHLKNVIDSATEIIISFDRNNRLTTWNNTAKELTGYSEKEIVNRSVSKLEIFNDPQQVLDIIKSVYQEKNLGFSNIVLLTKSNVKKIIRITGSVIKGENDQDSGILFIGKDITRDIETHGKLLPGNGYLIPDKTNTTAIDLFADLATTGYKGLFITRAAPEMIKSMPFPSTVHVMVHSQETLKDFESVPDLTVLFTAIKRFSEKNKNSVILLDGMHYLLTRFTFEKYIETLYRIHDAIAKNKALLFVRIDPNLVDKKQMAVIENELHLLPSQKIEGLIIEDDVYDALKYIFEQNQNNALVSFKKIMTRFKIAYSTAAKRLETLEEKELIYTKRQGKLRTVFISEKGRTLLRKRETA